MTVRGEIKSWILENIKVVCIWYGDDWKRFWLRGQRNGSQGKSVFVRVWGPEFDLQNHIKKESSDSHKLSTDIHTGTIPCAHKYTSARSTSNKWI